MMTNKNRALTLAVLLSCGSLLMPFYAYAVQVETTATIDNDITMAEDNGIGILAKGSTGASNSITINANITSSGSNGIGLSVSNGNWGNIILNEGKTIQANGDDGVAVLFGNNAVAFSSDTRSGSEEISASVTNFNVSGALIGQQNAILIQSDAMVNNINILSGASIQGNITSNSSYYTELTFGSKIGEDSYVADSNFNLSYSGSITGSSINMHIAGGTLEYNGTATVDKITIHEGATLSGKGTYSVSDSEKGFTNNGTFDLGNGINAVTINGNYTQSSSGDLRVDFNTDNQSDKLTVTGNATIKGTISLTPQVDYYFNGQTISLQPIVEANPLTVTEATTKINNISPVLKFELASDGTDNHDPSKTQYVIKVTRVENSYQSVADDQISAGIGSALDSNSNSNELQYIASADKEKLLSAIDFTLTPPNASEDIRKGLVKANIKKLNPNVVSSNAQAVLQTHTSLNTLISVGSVSSLGSLSTNIPKPIIRGGLGPTVHTPPRTNTWRNIVVPFAGYTDQHNGSKGYTNHNSGLIGAIERTLDNGLTHGYHAALNHQSTEDSGSTVKGEGLYLGAHASYAPLDWNGWSLFGSARLGVEQMRSHRTVYIPSLTPYFGTADADWTGYSGSLNIGAALTKEHGVMKSGPFAGLEYSFAYRPSVSEDGGAIRTYLESTVYDSLRTQLGYRLTTNPKDLDSFDGTQWQAHASVAWNHELLNDNGRTSYNLVEFPGVTIEDDVENYGRDSMSIAAGVVFKTPNRLDVGLTLGSDIYRKGGSSVYGKVNFEWKF